MIKKYANSIWYSFPVQLLIWHIKRNHFLILFWLLLIGFLTGALGSRYGIDLLFLDPEYFGKVDFVSFAILGFSLGSFFVVWNLTSYILNAHHFSFLATLNRPFGIYCINNAVLPLFFIILYIFKIISFQSSEGLLDFGNISYRIGGFICGQLLVLVASMFYFYRTNKNIVQFSGKKAVGQTQQLDPEEITHEEIKKYNTDVRVDFYLNHNMQVKLTRSADHYPESIIRSVYRQHHSNALFIELASLVLILLLSFLIDYPFFRIPAASSILLLGTILVMLTGAFSFWLGRWKIFFFILLVAFVNLLIRFNFLQSENKAYGLDYTTPAPYNYDVLYKLSDTAHQNSDREATTEILNNWKQKFDTLHEKPKMVFINCSGGGLRATMFVMQVLQQADSLTNHKLMQHCPLITGASGGMLAAAYYRELYYRTLQGEAINLSDAQYAQTISRDILNPIGFTLVVNDLFYPWQKFDYSGSHYRKDRGYMFEKVLNDNTSSVMDHPLSYYKDAEQKMEIPMMLFYPTILNDERKLFIGAQQFSYLCSPSNRLKHFSQPEIEGVDYHYLFENNNAADISFTTVLRMNCTFPYILPNVHLPTEPDIEVLDAGIRDNYGIQASGRFIEEFRDWIDANTSGVIVVNIRGIEQQMAIRNNVTQGVVERLVSPIGTLYNNWVEIQDFQNDNILNALDAMLDTKLEVITFDYTPDENTKRASLSLHLTAREKQDIVRAASNSHNTAAYLELQKLLR